MPTINRRRWIQQSLLASTAMLISNKGFSWDNDGLRQKQILDQILKLNWNENPYGPSEKAQKAMIKAISTGNRYPDSKVLELKNALASKFSLSAENVLLTAGSTEVLSLLGQHVGLIKGEILTAWPSFPTMLMFGEYCGASIKKVPLGKEERIDFNILKDSITSKTTLVFVCNPNNPTSTEVNSNDLRSFCKSVPENVLICVDEAYIEYSKNGEAGSMVSLVKELPNLIICRTFSKAYGLAGLRIGYAISSKSNIQELGRRHTGWELSAGTIPITGALTSLSDNDFLQNVISKNKEGRQIVYQAFDKWGVEYQDSSTNFIYAKSERFDKDLLAKLKAKNILITKWPDMTHHVRISISKPSDMSQFIDHVEAFLI